MKTSDKGKLVNELLAEVKSYDRSLKKHSEDDNLYYVKAGALVKLGEYTEDQAYYEQALACYGQAIDLAPQNSMYMVSRSELYIKLGRTALATQDLIAGQQSSGTGDKLLDMHTANMAKNILKLDTVQAEVKKLIASGLLSSELEGTFADAVKLISEAKQDSSVDLTYVKEKMTKLEVQYQQNDSASLVIKFMSEQIQQLQIQVQSLHSTVSQHDASIHDIQEQLLKLCTKEEFEQAVAQYKQTATQVELFGGKLKILEDQSAGHDIHLMTIDNTLKASNCFNKEQIHKDFASLKMEGPNEVLFNYANGFYWTLSNYLLAYRAISSGAVSGVRDQSQFEKLWNSVGSKILNAISSAVPVVGGVCSLIDQGVNAINNAYGEMKFDRKVAKINSVITGFLLEEDLSLAVADASVQIAKFKSNEILQQYNIQQQPMQSSQHKSPLGKTMNAIEEKIDKLITQVIKINKVPDNLAYSMAVKDVILLINYIATHDVILITSQSDAPNFSRVIAGMVTEHIKDREKAMQEAIMQNESKKDNCTVCAVKEVIYDNELLNHSKLVKQLVGFGIFEKVLAVQNQLSTDLLSQAISDNDGELIMAGLISLDSSY